MASLSCILDFRILSVIMMSMMRARKTQRHLSALCSFCVLIGCSNRQIQMDGTGGPGATETSSSGDLPSTAGVPTSGLSGTSNGTTAEGESTQSNSPDLPHDDDCFTWNDECPKGEKCVVLPIMPPDVFSKQKCRPVLDDPGDHGDDCTGAMPQGEDSCDRGLICYGGRCEFLCQGNPDDYTCPAQSFCVVLDDGAYGFCFDVCNPFESNCRPDEECTFMTDFFSCTVDEDPKDAGLFDSCDFHGDCDEGFVCALAASNDCAPGENCCTPLCDTAAAVDCPDAQQECVAISPPPLFVDHAGFCTI